MYLEEILDHHRDLARNETRDFGALFTEARGMSPTRGFERALRSASAEHLAVISEVKRRSPSKGDLFVDLDPVQMARTYERGGATCLSVLTDERFFGGSQDDLIAAHKSCSLPVLRKDFTVSAHDICDARLMGADAVLLIVAALSKVDLAEFLRLTEEIGLDALVEVHDEGELATALECGASMVGVNQRDLRTFEVDTDRAERLAPLMGDGVTRVAESGIRTAEDARRLRDAGYSAILVGESLVQSGQIETLLGSFLVS